MKRSGNFMRLVRIAGRLYQESRSRLQWLLGQPSIQAYYDSLKNRPLVSEGKGATNSLKPAFKTWKGVCNFYTHVERNQIYRKFIIIDIDRGERSRDMWIDKNMPEPTFIVRNRASGNCQYFYLLKTPVAYHENARKRIQQYYETIEQALCHVLEGDPRYHSNMARNPLHVSHQVIVSNTPYTLGMLETYFDRDEYPQGINSFLPGRSQTHVAENGTDSLGRNCTLFDTVRLWAYGAIFSPLGETLDSWQRAVTNMASEVNSRFTHPLSAKEVGYTAKSIYNWVWKNKSKLGRGKINRGAYRPYLDSSWSLRTKQCKSAHMTNDQRVSSSKRKLGTAVLNLKKQHRLIDLLNVIDASGLSRNTVKKYWSHVEFLDSTLHP